MPNRLLIDIAGIYLSINHDTGIVHENIQSSKLCTNAFNGCFYAFFIGDIQQLKMHLQIFSLQAGTGSHSFVRISGSQNHRNVLLAKPAADGIPEAPIGPAHQCHAFIMIRHCYDLNLNFSSL